jgi:Holliday junction DNA helicase RuvA
MISYIKGKVVNRGLNFLVVDTGGVGYKVFTTATAKNDGQIELHCHHHVREDANDLYGFADTRELFIFEMLLSVSGVGPKMALNIVGALGCDKIINAISKGDHSFFKSVSGVGNKVAMKIVVELKNKITGSNEINLIDNDDTMEALMSLGLKQDEVIPYLQQIPDHLTTTEDKVRFVLKNVGKKK